MQGFCVSVLFCFANVDVHCAFKAVLRRFSRRHAAHDTLGQTQTRDLVWRSALGQWAVETFVWQPARGSMRQRRAARWQRVYNETAHCRQTTKETRSATEIEWVQNYNDVWSPTDLINVTWTSGPPLSSLVQVQVCVLVMNDALKCLLWQGSTFILRVESIVCPLVNTYKNIKH